MSLFDFILSLLLVFNPGISEADFDNVYQLLDDSRIYSVFVDGTALDAVSRFSSSSVMPLDLTSQQSGWLKDIRDSLGGSYSIYSLVNSIQSDLGFSGTNTSLYRMLTSFNYRFNDFETYWKNLTTINSNLASIESMLHPSALEYYPRDMMRLVTDIKDNLLASVPGDVWKSSENLAYFNPSTGSYDFVNQSMAVHFVSWYNSLLYWMSLAPSSLILGSDGRLGPAGSSTLANFLSSGLMGLSYNLSGSDKTTAFTFLAEDIMQGSETVEVDNILDALGVMGTQLQNPLQRLAYVFANPLDLEIRDNVSDNQQAANDNFFKPGSPGSVKPSDIGDAAGFVSGAGDLLNSGASAGDMFTGLSHDSGYWSQATKDGLYEGNPSYSSASVVSDDDFDPFFSSLVPDDDGYYYFFNPSYDSDYLRGVG